jgi:predicted Rossmann fold nucleotide-binding protein DprA/Smf involved in DNA uptake
MTLSADSQVILLLCSHLGLPAEPEFAPLSLKEWNALARKLDSMSLRPGDVLGFGAEELREGLGVEDENAERIAHLLQRSGALAIELERLESLGIYVLTRADADYPARYRQRLKDSAPAVLFCSGEKALLGQPGIAVAGSRHLDAAGEACAEFVGNACGLSGLVLYSGGAKGVDTLSMNAALAARGTAVGILAESLERAIRVPENRAAISRGDLCLVTPYSPSAPFTVGTAMARNKLIYALADYAIIVASDAEKGGTWAGATEALKAKWVPVFVLDYPQMPPGNVLLLQRGALRFPHPFPEDRLRLKAWLEEHSAQAPGNPIQPSLFG